MLTVVPEVWAHRGARSVAPENTLAAARVALAQNAAGWELDVRITRDGVIIVVHDQGLRRVTNIACLPDMPPRPQHLVSQLSLDQIRRLDAGSWFARRDPFGTVASGQVGVEDLKDFAGETIPTLAEALSWTLDARFFVNIEMKDMLGGDDRGLVRGVAAEIKKSGAFRHVLVSSFRQKSLEYFRALCPEVPVGLLMDETALRLPTQEILARLKDLEAKALHPSLKGLCAGRIHDIRAEGFDVNVYTVNQAGDILRMVREGATAMITDYPVRTHAVLQSLLKDQPRG